jgi:hypothetical protein
MCRLKTEIMYSRSASRPSNNGSSIVSRSMARKARKSGLAASIRRSGTRAATGRLTEQVRVDRGIGFEAALARGRCRTPTGMIAAWLVNDRLTVP